jgi:ABC-2 type transport system ATP-binding protein
MIEINQLAKSFNGTRALDSFSLRVGAGELMGLVGPNGAGKTTLIRILSTLVAPNAGEAYVAGFNAAREPRAVRAVVGYLPDVPGLYQDMRVGEFLEFFADAFHLPPARKRAAVEEALERAGLASRRQHFVEQLSLGLKQRLLLAKTLLHGPRVLLLDEPATGLDPLARIELRQHLKNLNRQGVTILVSSHILSDLEDICSRVALIAEGRNAADAEGRTILDLRQSEEPHLICEIEVVGDTEAARAALVSFPEARLLEVTEARLRVELAGGEARAAALLRHLVAAGVPLLRFDPRPPALEERYRQAFGGNKP